MGKNKLTKPNPAHIAEDEKYFYNQRANPQVQFTIPLPAGYAHGPLWSINAKDGKPKLDCHQAIRYPWHGLISGPIAPKTQYYKPERYNMWVVFEHAPQFVDTPTSMLQYVDNAYLQNVVTKETEPCIKEAEALKEANGTNHTDTQNASTDL